MLPAWVGDVVASAIENGPELESAVAALQVSPLVKSVEKLADGSGVHATLWCIAEHKRRGSEQRQFTKDRTTLAACARSLLVLINEKHGAHLAAAEAAKAEAAADAAAAGPSAPTTAFEAMAAARHVQPAAEQAAAAEAAAAEAKAEQRRLEALLDAAGKAVEAAEDEATRLAEAADDVREAAGLARKRQKAAEAEAPEAWRGWSLRTWRKLESEEQHRRLIEVPEPIDDESIDEDELPELPPGGETRGWHQHWRRGVYGALRSWAKGSLGRVIKMLATAVKDFKVVTQVWLLPLLGSGGGGGFVCGGGGRVPCYASRPVALCLRQLVVVSWLAHLSPELLLASAVSRLDASGWQGTQPHPHRRACQAGRDRCVHRRSAGGRTRRARGVRLGGPAYRLPRAPRRCGSREEAGPRPKGYGSSCG